MRSPARFTLLASFLPCVAFAANPTDADLHSDRWWRQEAINEAAAITNPQSRYNDYLNIGIRSSDAGDLEQTTALLKIIDALPKPATTPLDPQSFLLKARVMSLAKKGQAQEAMTILEESHAPQLRRDVITDLTYVRATEALRTLAGNKLLTPEEVAACARGLLYDARLRLDKSAAAAALDLFPNKTQLPYTLTSEVHSTMRLDGTIDAPAARFLVEIMPDSPSRGDTASQTSRTLARKGFAEDALALILLAQPASTRAPALADVAKSLAIAGKADLARKAIADETDKNCITQGIYGLALGLAMHGDADAAKDLYATLKGQIGGDGSEFAVALSSGVILHGDFKVGVGQLLATSLAELRNRALSELVPQLIALKRLDDAAQLAAAYPQADYYAIGEKGRLFYFIAQAHRAAKDQPAVDRTIQSIDALLPAIPEKNKKEGTNRLAWSHASLGDSAGAFAIIAKYATPEERDAGRSAIATGLAENGDFASLTRLYKEIEAIPPKYVNRDMATAATLAAQNNRLIGLRPWIATWPDPESRAGACLFVSARIAELNAQAAATKPK